MHPSNLELAYAILREMDSLMLLLPKAESSETEG